VDLDGQPSDTSRQLLMVLDGLQTFLDGSRWPHTLWVVFRRPPDGSRQLLVGLMYGNSLLEKTGEQARF